VARRPGGLFSLMGMCDGLSYGIFFMIDSTGIPANLEFC
jgi:hypothetical protein